jgi:hypothetical protein
MTHATDDFALHHFATPCSGLGQHLKGEIIQGKIMKSFSSVFGIWELSLVSSLELGASPPLWHQLGHGTYAVIKTGARR